MLHQRHIRLIHKAVDDDLTQSERRQVAELLKERPEARQLLESLRKAVEAVKGLPEIDAPPALRQNIMNIVAATERRPSTASISFFDAIRQLVTHPQPAFRMALAASVLVGVMMSIVAYGLFIDAEVSTQDIVGTIGQPDVPKPWRLDDSTLVNAPNIRGSAKLFSRPDEVLVELNMTSDRPLRIEVLNEPASGISTAVGLPVVVQMGRNEPAQVSITRRRASWKGNAVTIKVMDGPVVLSEHRLHLSPELRSDGL